MSLLITYKGTRKYITVRSQIGMQILEIFFLFSFSLWTRVLSHTPESQAPLFLQLLLGGKVELYGFTLFLKLSQQSAFTSLSFPIDIQLQSHYLEPLTPTKTDAGLYGKFVRCFTGAS